MEPWVVTVAVCAAYLAVTLLMGLFSGRRASRSVTGYVAADRTMGTVVLYFVLGASIFSSFAFLGGPGWAYSRGGAAFYILGYGILGLVPLYFFGPRVRRLGERFGFVTQADLLAHRYGSRFLSLLLAVLSVAALVPYLTIQMKGAGYILAAITGGRVSEAAGAAITYGVVVTYVLWSGVLGVAWTNTFQGIFMMGVAWFLGLWLPHELYGGVGAMFTALAESGRGAMLAAPGLDASGAPWSWAGFSSAVVVSAAGFSMWPHLFMKSYAAKDERTLRLTVVMYPTFQLFLIPILLIGFAGILAFPGVAPADTILPHILTQISLSPLLVGLVCAGTLAASMSSGDAILHAAASIGVHDGLGAFRERRLSDAAERRAIRILVVALALVAFYFAVVSERSIVGLLLAAYGGVAQILPLVLAAFYWPRVTRAGALAGLGGGLVASVAFLLVPAWRPWPDVHEGLYGLAVNLVLLVAVSLLTRPEPADHVAAYVDGV